MRIQSALFAASLLAAPAWPQAAEEAPRMAGSDVPAPKRTKFIAPEYPADARARGLRGIVILELVIDTQGKVASATVTRSVPPFDEAALTAARHWEYEVTRVDGKAVPVRLNVPITFTMPIPRVSRQEGIPELVQGTTPVFPAQGAGAASVVAEVTLEPSGQVAEAEIRSGESPFADALVQALKTWRFTPDVDGSTVSFRVEADFIAGERGGAARVDLRLTGLRRSEGPAVASPSPAPAPPATPEPQPQAALPPAASPEAPTPATVTVPSPPPALPSPPPAGPPVEVLGPLPEASPRPVAPPPAPEVPVSAVRDVTLLAGVPDLVKGRRPVVPPLARMASATGTVEVRFGVDAAGVSAVQEVSGPELLKEAAQQAVASWVFRRTTTERLHLAASLVYGPAAATATVRKEE